MPGGDARQRVFVDKAAPDLQDALTEFAHRVRATAADVGLDRRLVELVNIRCSQMNGCAPCLDVHVRRALLGGESTQRIAVLPAWQTTSLFTEPERAALTLAEAVTVPRAAGQDDQYAAAAQVLSDEQVAAVVWVAITINAFNRVSVSSGHPVRPQPTQCPQPTRSRSVAGDAGRP